LKPEKVDKMALQTDDRQDAHFKFIEGDDDKMVDILDQDGAEEKKKPRPGERASIESTL